MFDCHLLERSKRRGEKRVLLHVWCTGVSDPWNLGTPPMRRHTPQQEGSNEKKRVIKGWFPYLLHMKTEDRLRRGAILVIAPPKNLAWHTAHQCIIYIWERRAKGNNNM